MSDRDWIIDKQVTGLIRRHARRLARSRGFLRSDQDDIEQELSLLLLRKAHLFDSNRAKPVTFAKRLIENKVRSLARAACSQKRGGGSRIYLNDTIEEAKGRVEEILASLDESAGRRHIDRRPLDAEITSHLKLDIAATNESLSKEQRDVAAVFSHVPKYAAAKVLGISRRQMSIHVGALREVYEKRGLGA